MKPSILKGTRDFGPTEVRRRNYIFDTVRATFEKFGFEPIETPAMENLSTLTGKYGEEGDQLLFKVLNNGDFLRKANPEALANKNSQKLAYSIARRGMRYDLTVPFARFVVMHQNDIVFPFKRFQIQPVWRGDKPQRGRYQEFYQCDADVVGSDALINEVELTQIFDEAFANLDLSVTIKLNNRKILSGLAEVAGIADQMMAMTIAIDKLDKIGEDGVVRELEKKEIPESAIKIILDALKLKSLDQFDNLFANSEIGQKGLAELKEVFDYLSLQTLANKVEFDITLARGLNYYTGCIFEVMSNDVKIGSIGGGGRYDDLTAVFGLKGVSGVGISFGADRIYDVLEELDKFPDETASSLQLLLVAFDEPTHKYAFSCLNKIRAQGIRAELYPKPIKLAKQMKYANAKGIPKVALIGEEEMSSGKFTVKNMESGDQEKLSLDELIAQYMIPKYTTLAAVQEGLKAGKITCQDLVTYYLERCEASRSLNAYIEIYREEALLKARAIDDLLATSADKLGPCFGLVISLKDNLCQKGKKVSAASAILKDFTSLYSATAIERLEQAGAIVIGRTNCDQFGMGSSNENSIYGPVRNADDPARVPGGSSGGSAASVQADTCLLAIGSDTGGSIRQPAGFCGLYGLKPSYGRISRHGLLAYASSFDQIGFIGRSPEDLALVLEMTAGPDDFDASMLNIPAPVFNRPFAAPQRKKIAFIKSAIDHPGMDPEIKTAQLNLIEELQAKGYECEGVPLDLIDYVVPTYYTLTTAEASTNLARYDGIRYGERGEGTDLQAVYTKSRSQGFSTEVKRRILLGTFVLGSGYYEAYYGKAQKIRGMLLKEVNKIFEDYAAILMPVSPVPAWKIGEKNEDPTEMYLADIFTVLANLTGLPALAIPLDRHSNGTMFAYQLLSPKLQENTLFNIAQDLKN